MEQFRKLARRILQEKEKAEGDTETYGDPEVRQVDALATLIPIFVILYFLGYIIGLIRLISNWQRFEGRNIGMLLVTFLLPFGFMWPLFAK
jgi:hypothetical protein